MTYSCMDLTERCQGIRGGSGQAIDWVKDVRRTAESVDGAADTMVEELRRYRYKTRQLGNALSKPLSVGVFGVSQAGKSFLISTLAMNEGGELETKMGNDRLNFISHINPSGGGGEATGLVTRFTCTQSKAPDAFPVDVKLLSESDIIKIFANSYAFDFDAKFKETVDVAELNARIASLSSRRQPTLTGGIDEDDMVDIMDYCNNLPGGRLEAFWNQAVDLAPYLTLEDRSRLLGVLWGDIDDLSRAYRSMCETLTTLGHASQAFLSLDALVTRSDDPGAKGFSQRNGIVNVDILSRLGKDAEDQVKVLPVSEDGGFGTETSVARSGLAALVAELKIVLADQPKANVMDKMDLLDFPGYRGRLKVPDYGSVKEAVRSEGDADPVAALLLRGKVAYLFERYISQQEMSFLLLCTRSNAQIEINELADAVDSWVTRTQGEDASKRGKRRPGLIWAFTQLDLKMSYKGSESLEMRRGEWNSMVEKIGLERFDRCEWVNHWSDDKPFDNMFLVRKPGLAGDLFVTDKETRVESGIREDMKDHMDLLKQSFMEADAVNRHFSDPKAAWEAMIAPNDGGMSRIAAYLSDVANYQDKIDRIGEQVSSITENIVEDMFGNMFSSEGPEEVSKKQRIADEVRDDLGTSANYFAEFLSVMQPKQKDLKELYLQVEQPDGDDEPTSVEDGSSAIGGSTSPFGGLNDIFGDLAGASVETAKNDGDASTHASGSVHNKFAKAVVQDWQRNLSRLSTDKKVQSYMKISSETVSKIATELSVGASRLNLIEQMSTALEKVERRSGLTRYALAGQQVKIASRELNNFIDYLGLSETKLADRPDSLSSGQRKTFERPKEPFSELPENEVLYSREYVLDWFIGFKKLAVDNIGHSSGRDITPDQNYRLGQIIAQIQGKNGVEDTPNHEG